MLNGVFPLPIGNALRVQLTPPPGALLWNVLRNTTGVFPSYNDPASVQVASATNQTAVYDSSGLANGTPYFYSAFYWDGEEWLADGTVGTGTPAASYYDGSTDALSLLRSRLASGLANEVAMGNLEPGPNANGLIQVLTAPPVLENLQFPLVVVHLESESPVDHGIGELIDTDIQGVSGDWNQSEGWIARTTLSVTAWTLNPDTRIAMRKALRRLVIGNLQVLNAAGLRQIEFTQQDQEDLSGSTYAVPLYWAAGTFTCLSPLVVGGTVAPISDVTVTVNPVTISVSETLGNSGYLQ